jgi:hypothetical protein
MTNDSIPTLAERSTFLERVSVARCLARRPARWPSAAEVQTELQTMGWESTRGVSFAQPTSAQAAAFLKSIGAEIPPVDKIVLG